MSRKTPIALLAGWLGLALSPTLPVRASDSKTAGSALQQTGIVSGQVSNVATRSYLEGAVVALTGTKRTTTTDPEGRYFFSGVPAGQVTLMVSYPGLDSREISVTTHAGRSTVHNIELTSAIYRMEKFTVAGEREGTAKAETLQRQAPNVKNVVSSDTFGNITDANIGDFLQHIAGITGDYSGPDVRQVKIRGVEGSLNSVTMDGQQIASSNNGTEGRAVEFQQVSLADIETIEVTKAPTPDMNGDSIGGSVNLVTKSAFNRAGGRAFNYTVGFATQSGYMGRASRWKQPIPGFSPSLNFGYSDVLGEKKNIGVNMNLLFHNQPVGGAVITQAFENRLTPGPVYTSTVTRRMVHGATRSRLSYTTKLEYKWSERTAASVNFGYNFFHANNDTRVHSLVTPKSLATVDANGNRIGGGLINPTYSDNITRVYAGPGSVSTVNTTTYDKSGRTYVLNPAVRYRSEGLSMDYSLNYSSEATYYDVSHDDDKFNSRPKGAVTFRLPNVGWTVDRSSDPVWPTVTQTAGPDIYDLNNYSGLVLNQNDRRAYDTIVGGKFDLRKAMSMRSLTWVKTGVLHQQQSRKLWNDPHRYNYTGPDGILGTADDNLDLGQFQEDSYISTSDENKYYKGRGGVPPWPNNYGIARHQKLHPELWKEDVPFNANAKAQSLKLMTEAVTAAYVMGNLRMGDFSALTGVRFEETRRSGEGPLNVITPAERARRAAWVGVVTDAEARRRAEAQFGNRASNEGRNRVVLPSLHLKYEPFAGFVTRASWSTGIGKPSFGSLIPNENVNDNARRVTVNNPKLNPQYANSYDLAAEYYLAPQGMVSVGVFRKKISDYIFTDTSQTIGSGAGNGFDGEYEGYSLATQNNGGFAKIEGMELSYQQQLTFLPGSLKGFGLNANFTSLRTEGDYGGGVVLTTNSLPNFLNKSGSAGLSYRGYGFDVRLAAIFRGEHLRTNSTNPALVRYRSAKTMWNWKSRYAVSRRLSIYLDVENIMSVAVNSSYLLYPDRVDDVEVMNTKIMAGVTGRF